MKSEVATPLSIAVLGGGHWGPHLIRNFQDGPDTSVTWVVEPRDDRRAALATRFRGIRIVGDADPVLLDPQVDAVVIATPTSTHGDLVRSALEAGKHVLVEKPLTNSAKIARSLCELAHERGLVLMVGHVFLFNPAVQAAKRILEGGELGDIYYASLVRTNLGPVRTDVDAAWDLASHDVSIANYWLGSTPIVVSCRGGSWLNQGIDDAIFATLDYPGGVLVHIHASWLHPRKSRDLVLVGSKRMLSVNDMDLTEPLRIYDKRVEDRSRDSVHDTFASFRASIREGSITIPSVSLGEPLRAECEEFVRRLMGNGGSMSDGWQALDVVRAVEAMTISASRGGARVSLDEVD